MHFDIDNIDEVWEDLKGKSKVHYAIKDTEWRKRQFAIYDTNGYMLEFGQDLNWNTKPCPLFFAIFKPSGGAWRQFQHQLTAKK